MALELSSKFRAFENTKLWNVQSVKSSEEWLEVLELSDRIKRELKVDVTQRISKMAKKKDVAEIFAENIFKDS